MNFLLKLLSFIGLGLSVIPSFMVFYNQLDLVTYKQLMLVGTVLWLVTAPWWINKDSNAQVDKRDTAIS